MTTHNDFASAYRAAGSHGTPGERIDAIKEVVAVQLESVDPSAQVKKTEFFNHTMGPDLVLSWRDESSRFVYIRPNNDPRELMASVDRLPKDHGLVYTPDLSGLSREDVKKTSHGQTLVTQPSSLEALAAGRSSTPARLLAHGVMNEGVGLLNLELASAAVRSTDAAFGGAIVGDGIAVMNGAEVWSDLLSHSYSTRLVRLTQALWEGSRGQALDFPLPDLLNGNLTDVDLQYLLNEVEDPGVDFWGRIGWSVTSEQIGRLKLEDRSRASFQNLMSALRDRVTVKAICFGTHTPSVFDDGPTPNGEWSLSKGCLVLTGWGWNAFLAPSHVDQLPVEEKRYPGLTSKELVKRAKRAMIPILDVRSAGSKVITTIEGSSGALDVDDVDRIVESTKALVSAATVRGSGGGRLSCNFETRSATGKTSSKFAVWSMIRDSVFLLNQIPDTLVDEIRDFFADETDALMLPAG